MLTTINENIISVNVGQRLPKQLLQNFPGIWIGRHLSEWSSRYPWPDSLRSQDEGPIQVDGDKHDHLLTMTGVKKFNLILNISSIKMVYKERRYAPAYFHDIVGMAPFRFNYLHLQPQLFFNFGSKWVHPQIQNVYFGHFFVILEAFFGFSADISWTVALCQKLKKADPNYFSILGPLRIQYVHIWPFLGELSAKDLQKNYKFSPTSYDCIPQKVSIYFIPILKVKG